MFHNKGAEYIHLLILMLSDIIIRIVLYYQTFKVNKIVKKKLHFSKLHLFDQKYSKEM